MLPRSVIALVLLGSVVMAGTTRGDDAIEREGRARATTVIAALEQFHKQHGYYPKQLNELVPRYIPDSAALHFKGEALYKYTLQTKGGYTLSFTYGIPATEGPRSVIYFSGEKRWRHWGYY